MCGIQPSRLSMLSPTINEPIIKNYTSTVHISNIAYTYSTCTHIVTLVNILTRVMQHSSALATSSRSCVIFRFLVFSYLKMQYLSKKSNSQIYDSAVLHTHAFLWSLLFCFFKFPFAAAHSSYNRANGTFRSMRSNLNLRTFAKYT